MHRERSRERQEDRRRDAPSGDGSNLDALRDEAEGFLTAGDRAIDQALSGNSEAFNTSNKQDGGQ